MRLIVNERRATMPRFWILSRHAGIGFWIGRSRALATAVLAAIALAAFPVAPAQAQDGKFDVKVMSIRATKANTDIDASLKDLAEQLKKETKLTGFKLEKSGGGSTEKGKDAIDNLGNGYRTKVTPIEKKDGRVTMQVEIFRRGGKGKDKDKGEAKERSVINTKVTLDAGKYQLWALDHPEGGEDKLIIAVSAK
ncbi:MAG: hypothetical protein ACKVS9_03030 [Phycisphaerae bacterium]